MLDFDLTRDDGTEIAVAAGIALAGFVLAWLVSRLSRRVVHIFTHATQTEIDDILADAVRGPVVAFIALQGVFIGLRTVARLEPHYGTVDRIWVALTIVVIFAAVRRVSMALLDWIASGERNMPGLDSRSLPFVRRILNVIIIAVALLLVLEAFGVSISPLLAGLGIGGLAVALALQPLLTNIFASSYVITDQSVAVGDYVEVGGGPVGTVEDIGWRATRVRTFDNNIVMVPNAALADSVITNFDSADARADARVDCGIAYEEDLDHVEGVVLEELHRIMEELEVVDHDREPLFRYSEFGDSNINFFVKMRAVTWADSFLLKHEMMKRIHRRLAAEGIVINYPARRLVLASEDAEGLDRLTAGFRTSSGS